MIASICQNANKLASFASVNTNFKEYGTNTPLIIASVFVLAEEIFLTISESGNNVFNKLVVHSLDLKLK